MNKVIVAFMDKYRPSKNDDKEDRQVFLEMLEQFIVTTFFTIFQLLKMAKFKKMMVKFYFLII